MQETEDMTDVTDFITNYQFRMDFEIARDVQLYDISKNIFNVFIYIILPMLMIHLLITTLLMVKDQSFRKLPILEKCVHIFCNIFLLIPQ